MTETSKFEDYTVISRSGDDANALQDPVSVAMSKNWIPVGGINIAGPLPNGVMLFSQAMALPTGARISLDKKF